MRATYYNSISVRAIGGAALGALLLFTARGSAQEVDAGQVVKDIRAGATRLEAAELRMKTWECKLSAQGKSASVSSTIKRHNKSILVQFDQAIMVRNPSELFAVKRASQGRSWALSSYKKHGGDGAYIQAKDGYFAFYPLLAVENDSTIVQRLDVPTFKPKLARAAAGNRVELDYEYTVPASDPGGSNLVVNGTFTLAPDLDWLVVRSAARFTGGPVGQVDCVMERQAVRDGDSIRVTSTQYGCARADPQYNRKINHTYKLLPPETVDPAEFDLSHYGIEAPEYEVYEDRKRFNWTFWGGIGLICIVLSLILAWLARRKQKRT